jgi:cell division protein FtsB
VPAGPRSTSRPGAGPGRGRPRARPQHREREGVAPVVVTPRTAAAAEPRKAVGALRRGIQANLTARALALLVVLLVLTISYATSLRIYFAQAHDIADTKAEIATRQARIATLQGDLTRWNDPAYVKTQARERLGWVVPGETGYTVVGADGKPLGGGLSIDSETAPAGSGTAGKAWWGTLWGSVEAADKPAPAKKSTGPTGPITTKTKTR